MSFRVSLGRAVRPGLLALYFLFACPSPSWSTIRYEISLDQPELHVFHVTMIIPEANGQVSVQMPAWNALYQIRDFSSHVQQVEAFAGSERVQAEKLDKQTWLIRGKGTITVRYGSYWDEPGPFAAQLNTEHAFVNLAMVLLYVPERRNENVELTFGSSAPRGWRFAIPLKEKESQLPVAYTARDYDELVDAPVEAGNFEEFTLPDVHSGIHVVVHGENWNRKHVEEILTRICQYELKLMKDTPFSDYTFFLHVGRTAIGARGGMEHANSTAIAVPSDEYLANVAAHEFFHLWNVKRIRPASLEPVDYAKEQYTRALWFAEGVTNTYGAYTLVRTGIWNKQQFYEDLGAQISELEARPANRWQSAEESSLDAWLEKYSLYNQPAYSVSYYTKGQILGTLLDILIRDRTGNQKSLDDVLRAMNSDFPSQDKPYRDSLDIRLTAEKVAGASFGDFFQNYVSGVEPLPYQRVLALAGLDLRTVALEHPTLGFFAERDPSGNWTVRAVDVGGAAEQTGLRTDDVILSWDDGEPPRNLVRWLRQKRPGDLLRLRVRRGEPEISVEFRLGASKETFYQISEDPRASESAKRIREGLLRGRTESVSVP